MYFNRGISFASIIVIYAPRVTTTSLLTGTVFEERDEARERQGSKRKPLIHFMYGLKYFLTSIFNNFVLYFAKIFDLFQ